MEMEFRIRYNWKERFDLSAEVNNLWSYTSTPLYVSWNPCTGTTLFLGFLHELKNTASCVPHDVAQLLYQGVLYVEIVVRFHATRLSEIYLHP
jgi:hypothetical protein